MERKICSNWGYPDRRRIHNLKYFTWIEQQQKSLEELNDQWNDFPEFWDRIHGQVDEIDRLIEAFNRKNRGAQNPVVQDSIGIRYFQIEALINHKSLGGLYIFYFGQLPGQKLKKAKLFF